LARECELFVRDRLVKKRKRKKNPKGRLPRKRKRVERKEEGEIIFHPEGVNEF